MSISAVVVRSLTTQARSRKVRSATYVRQLQSFHYHIARLARRSLLVCVAGCENIATRSGPTRRRPAFEIGLVQSPDDHTRASPNNMRTLNCASQRAYVDEGGKGYAQRSPISKCLGTVMGTVVTRKIGHRGRRPIFISSCFTTRFRAGDRARTGDVQLGKLAFYQLNYARTGGAKRPVASARSRCTLATVKI
jgi:hypothetical protein